MIVPCSLFNSLFNVEYSFSLCASFPPPLWEHLVEMFNGSQSPYLICYNRPKNIIGKYGFNVELLAQTPTSMHGSQEIHSGYIYRRIGGEAPSNGTVACDASYRKAQELVNGSREQLGEFVSRQVQQEAYPSNVGKRIRNKRVPYY